MQTRRDAYRSAGVDIDAGNRTVDLIRDAVGSTHGPRVLSATSGFGGAYALDDGTVLIASADSVGTKLRLAARLGRYAGVGVDLVNHCINDILTVGAHPLFFLDYFASSAIRPEMVAAVVEGLARACRDAGCALLGGETAELPGMYVRGEYDVAGFIVGAVRRDRMLDPAGVRAGDALIGLPSSGLHTNGFSLVNHLMEREDISNEDLLAPREALGGSLADLLLEPHRSYLPEVAPLLDAGVVRGIAHITGGGLPDNLPRCLPDGLTARVDTHSWSPPPIFGWIQERGDISAREMYRVFNMGVGLVLVVSPADIEGVLKSVPGAWLLGSVEAGAGGAELAGLPDA